jgi:dTDP-4-amino-4,6-dideoxygalactose transaminase
MNHIQISKPNITDAEKAAVMEVMESGFLAQGPRTALFEERFAKLCGVKHAIAVSNGTCALQIALLANDIGPGDEVITTPFTFMATANAILFAGAKPVFVDIESDTFNIDPEQIEAAITPKTKAIMPVHLYGHMCNMDRIQAIADLHGLKIIEDACQSVKAYYKGKYAGSYGTGTFSFYATKNLMTGEGGMITTNDDAVAEKCRMIRSHGMKQRYYHDMIGYNFRMMDLQAAIGLVQLDRLETMMARRRFNAGYLNQHIETVTTPKVQKGCEHVWHQYTVKVNGGRKRDDVVKHMNNAGIDVGIYYPVPVHKQKSIQGLVGDVRMPVAEKMSVEVLSLPVHPLLSEEDLDKIVTEINKL